MRNVAAMRFACYWGVDQGVGSGVRMVEIYVAPEVADVLALYPELSDAAFRQYPIKAQISRHADRVLAGHQQGDRRIAMHVMCWWPSARGRSLDDVMGAAFSSEDALLTMSREYGFADWSAVLGLGDIRPEPDFEQAVDLMLAGDIAALERMIDQDENLPRRRSRYGHQATLLHYLAANGVESHRQVMPMNAVAMGGMLVARGADPAAEAHMYGGGQTALALAASSAHPRNAGLSEGLNRVLAG